MVRVFAINNHYGVYVYAEANQPHHLPHCEVRWAGNSAQIALPTLALIVGVEPPREIWEEIEKRLEEICDKWDTQNPTLRVER